MEEKALGYVVSETHWDREWYLTFQEFRKWLVRLIDNLLDETGKHQGFRGFMLDGQTLVLEDYLQVRPQNREALKRLIQTDKIQIGPWYVLADEFLESGEALIRNLLLGHKICNEFGNTMKVGYVPDTFGHIAQLPQILQGFNIDYGYGFRGYPPLFGNHTEYKGHNDDTPLEHYWGAPNTKWKILMLHHITGYSNMSNACVSPMIEDGHKIFVTGISKVADAFHRLKARQRSNLYLFMNGSDHLEPEFDIPAFIEFFNNEEDIQEEIPVKLKHATLAEYFNHLDEKDLDLPLLTGEWRGSMYTQVTPACISTRMYLKQQNFECQRELEKYAEPLSTFAWMLGGTYDYDLLWESWRWTIKNHPHDSICGCSLDRVHDDMETRFDWALDIAKDMSLNSIGEITTGINDKKLINDLKQKHDLDTNAYDVITVFNPIIANGDRCQIAEGIIQVNPKYTYRLFKSDGTEVDDFLLIPIEDYRMLEGGQYYYKKFHNTYSCGKLIIPISDLPHCGYSTYLLAGSESENGNSESLPRQQHTNVLDSEFLGKNITVTFNPNGSFDIQDNKTGAVYRQLNLFEDMADDGDEYDYAPLENEKPLLSHNLEAKFELLEQNAVRSVIKTTIEFPIPEGLIDINPTTRKRSESLVKLRIMSSVKIYKDSDTVEIVSKFDNIAKSHRLRALFPTGLDTKYSHADDHFTVMKRTVELPRDDGWFQDMQGIYHQDTFIDLNDGKRGLAVFNRGLPEYEIVKRDFEAQEQKGNVIALTLVRGVEWLSQRGHLGRKSGLNGPNLRTPGAQCLRKFSFEYAVHPHRGDWNQGNVYRHAYSYVFPPRTFDKKQIRNLRIEHLNDNPAEWSMLSMDNDKIVLSALKRPEQDLKGADENGLIFRCFNPTNQTQKSNIIFGKKCSTIWHAKLCEQSTSEIDFKIQGKTTNFSIELKPHEIYTLHIVIEKKSK